MRASADWGPWWGVHSRTVGSEQHRSWYRPEISRHVHSTVACTTTVVHDTTSKYCTVYTALKYLVLLPPWYLVVLRALPYCVVLFLNLFSVFQSAKTKDYMVCDLDRSCLLRRVAVMCLLGIIMNPAPTSSACRSIVQRLFVIVRVHNLYRGCIASDSTVIKSDLGLIYSDLTCIVQ